MQQLQGSNLGKCKWEEGCTKSSDYFYLIFCNHPRQPYLSKILGLKHASLLVTGYNNMGDNSQKRISPLQTFYK